MNIGIEKGIGSEVLFIPVARSTNTFLKINSMELPDGIIVWVDTQTQGRGRGSNKWYSPSEKGLYFSVLLKNREYNRSLPVYSLAAGLAVKEGIERYAAELGLNPKLIDLKWPNDLLIAGRKIAGILLESINNEKTCDVIIGVGVNISNISDDMPPEIVDIAGSLEYFYGGKWRRKNLLKSIAEYMESRFRDFRVDDTITDFRNNSRMWGKECVLNTEDEEIHGVCKNISSEGSIVIETCGKEKSYISGRMRLKW